MGFFGQSLFFSKLFAHIHFGYILEVDCTHRRDLANFVKALLATHSDLEKSVHALLHSMST